ncbi:MAG: Rieske (2Fe-2S) protein [Deltaproteobacteria bacterium]|nr:Rieske (2Fe-2S) protein [Deltaproteobacteria bacterium]
MPSASLMALAADLLGEDPRTERERFRLPLATVADQLGPGEVQPARAASGEDVAVYADESGAIYAVADACPHDGGPLSSGFIEDGRLVCARHGWEFEAGTGVCPGRRARICPRRVR